MKQSDGSSEKNAGTTGQTRARSRILMLATAALVLWTSAQASPFRDLRLPFTQPDGTRIEITGSGDEFYAVFETPDGFTVVFNLDLKAYCFAQAAINGQLVSTGRQVHLTDPAALGLVKSADSGTQGNLLVRDALTVLKGLPNYTTEILPALQNVTVDDNNRVVACNVFYAGENGGVWSKGLWPHWWALHEVGSQELSPGGTSLSLSDHQYRGQPGAGRALPASAVHALQELLMMPIKLPIDTASGICSFRREPEHSPGGYLVSSWPGKFASGRPGRQSDSRIPDYKRIARYRMIIRS